MNATAIIGLHDCCQVFYAVGNGSSSGAGEGVYTLSQEYNKAMLTAMDHHCTNAISINPTFDLKPTGSLPTFVTAVPSVFELNLSHYH